MWGFRKPFLLCLRATKSRSTKRNEEMRKRANYDDKEEGRMILGRAVMPRAEYHF